MGCLNVYIVQTVPLRSGLIIDLPELVQYKSKIKDKFLWILVGFKHIVKFEKYFIKMNIVVLKVGNYFWTDFPFIFVRSFSVYNTQSIKVPWFLWYFRNCTFYV